MVISISHLYLSCKGTIYWLWPVVIIRSENNSVALYIRRFADFLFLLLYWNTCGEKSDLNKLQSIKSNNEDYTSSLESTLFLPHFFFLIMTQMSGRWITIFIILSPLPLCSSSASASGVTFNLCVRFCQSFNKEQSKLCFHLWQKNMFSHRYVHLE